MKLKIISGGQTGVDQGALDFALESNFFCGGWCPKGRISENGKIPLKYPLVELEIPGYEARTEKNVMESDATLIIVKGAGFGEGTKLTASFCGKYQKPFLFIDLDIYGECLDEIRRLFNFWMQEAKVSVLNIAGAKESEVKDIQIDTKNLLNYLFK